MGQKPLNWVLCGQLSQRCHRLFKRRLKWGRTLPPSPNCLLAGLVSSWIVGLRVSVPHKLLVTGFLQFLAMRVTTLFIPSEQEEPESFSNTEFSLFFLPGHQRDSSLLLSILLDWNHLLKSNIYLAGGKGLGRVNARRRALLGAMSEVFYHILNV